MKKVINKNEKGITLIALVITIIVLLILAGVAISMLTGENRILNQSANAKTKTEQASTEEAVKLAVLSAMTAGNGKLHGDDAFSALNKGLDDAGYKGNDITELPATIIIGNNEYKINEDGTLGNKDADDIPDDTPEEVTIESLIESGDQVTGSKLTVKDDNDDEITIPVGFSIASDSATLVKDGIVVVAPDKSEFVWVPVEDINSMVMCQGSTGANDCSITKQGEVLVCETHSKDICGKLYATDTGNNFDSKLNTQTYSKKSGLREPAVLTDTRMGDYATGKETRGIALLKRLVKLEGTDEEIKGKWESQLQGEYEEMAKSVYENKGFYVGRYETSLDDNKNAQSIKNKPSATVASDSADTWYGLYQKEKEYSKKEYEEGKTLDNIVGSSMIWGSQYDQMMIWMEENGYTVTSTDADDLKGAVRNETQTTGNTSYNDILNNVYDLLGCSIEWTLEADDTEYRVSRGGFCDNSISPSGSSSYYPYVTFSTYSSRVSLYIK